MENISRKAIRTRSIIFLQRCKTVYTIQAVAISTELAHNLGQSESNSIRAKPAVKTSQCLGVHKISNSRVEAIGTPEQHYEKIERELGKMRANTSREKIAK